MGKSYQDRYTWSHGLRGEGHEALCHTDGSISIAIKWDGFQTSLKVEEDIAAMVLNLKDALHTLAPNYELCVENHFIRDHQDTTCRDYVRYGRDHIVRCHALAMRIREDIASTVASVAMNTKLVMVMTLQRRTRPWARLLGKREIVKVKKLAGRLSAHAARYMVHLPGATLLSYAEFEFEIWSAYHRERSNSQSIPSVNARFALKDRLATKPRLEDGLLVVGNTYTKVLLLLDYPDADTNWFYGLASHCGVEMHITQIIKPENVDSALFASSRATTMGREIAEQVGGEAEAAKLLDHAHYRELVTSHNLHIFKNAYIVKLHCENKEHLLSVIEPMLKIMGKDTVVAGNHPEMSYLYWRISQMGQGHLSPFMRQDHSLQVANMAPVISFSKGDTTHLQMLRLDANGQAIAFSYPKGGTNHAATAAKTGGGKGVEMVAQICEMYPLGVNFFLTEVGTSYKWAVEAHDGAYFHLTPEIVVSPFPAYSLADPTQEFPMDKGIADTTISVLMPLISKGHEDTENHIFSVALQVMQDLYRQLPGDGALAPTMGTYFDRIDMSIDQYQGVQYTAAKVIRENLNSFLLGAGSNFRNADTLDFSAGIVGLDFSGLMNSPELAKFLLCFVALRFKQMAFANATPTRIVIDELHEFTAIDPDLVALLIKQLTRRGRQKGAAFHGITQEAMDMDLERGILNQITNRNLFYTQHGHEAVAKVFGMNSPTLACWKAYRDPEKTQARVPYRNGIRMVGDEAFDLHLIFPESVMALAHSSPDMLALKEDIGSKTRCPFERIEAFRQAVFT